MKNKWRKILQRVSKVAQLSILVLFIVGMTGCLGGGGGMGGCGLGSCTLMQSGSDWTGIFAFILVCFLMYIIWQKFKKK